MISSANLKRILWAAGLPALIVAFLDHASKWWAVDALCRPRLTVTVIPNFWSFRCSYNTGSAFGLFQGSGDILTIVGVAALGFVGYLIWKHPFARLRSLVALGLIAGGAIGNIADRMARGHVVDFIDWYIGPMGPRWHWPAFNIADAALVIGVAMIMIWPEKSQAPEPVRKSS